MLWAAPDGVQDCIIHDAMRLGVAVLEWAVDAVEQLHEAALHVVIIDQLYELIYAETVQATTLCDYQSMTAQLSTR